MNALKAMKATAFQRIRILCPDLKSAVRDYQLLLGIAPCRVGCAGASDQDPSVSRSSSGEGDCAWFVLGNTMLELLERADERAGLAGLVLATDNVEAMGARGHHSRGVAEHKLDPAVCRNLWISVVEDLGASDNLLPASGAAFYPREAPATSSEAENSAIHAVDHLVLHTNDADDCVRLFGGGGLGIRLALDKHVPEWGGRMLFFRTGKLTLEIIQPNAPFEGDDFFWGIAYQVGNIQAVHQRLSLAGVSLSEPRKGRKPGTWVVTVNSHQLGIPTLLVQA